MDRDIQTVAKACASSLKGRNVRSLGPRVRVDDNVFQTLLARSAEPLVLHQDSGGLIRRHMYLTVYKGVTFTCVTRQALTLPSQAEVVEVRGISTW
jgi:hypothetical protein